MMFRDACKGQFEWRTTIAPLLGDWVVLLAMRHQRAPLPVSSALWKDLLRKGFLNDLDELALFARRYLFLGDARLLLAELRIRTATTPPVRETSSIVSKIAVEDRPATLGHRRARCQLTETSSEGHSTDARKVRTT
jgi:hypothetical protein